MSVILGCQKGPGDVTTQRRGMRLVLVRGGYGYSRLTLLGSGQHRKWGDSGLGKWGEEILVVSRRRGEHHGLEVTVSDHISEPSHYFYWITLELL